MEITTPKLSVQSVYTFFSWVLALVLNLTHYKGAITDIVTAASGLITAAHVHGLHVGKASGANPRA